MKKTPILHPFFFAVYLVFGLYAQNPQELPMEWLVRPLLLSLGLTTLLFLLTKRWTGDPQHAGLITTLGLGWLFFGHLRNALMEVTDSSFSMTQQLLLLGVWSLLLFFLGSKWLWKRIKIPELVTNFLNVTSWAVILLPTYFVISFTVQSIQQARILHGRGESQAAANLSASSRPDIYVIILDAYAREDFLRDVFQYDNSGFTSFLREKGFYVADESSPNYPQTQLSLSSLLNFMYLDDWARGLEETNGRAPFINLIEQSQVIRSLDKLGYTIVNVPNTTLIGNLEDSDIYLPMSRLRINEFEGLILSTTVLDIFAEGSDLPIPGYTLQRRATQYQLDTLKTIPEIPGPKFVLVHILAPHPPFVFDAEGNPVQSEAQFTLGDGAGFPGTCEEYRDGYTQELAYINQQMEQVVTSILENSRQEPIIILQGDHGPGSYFSMLKLEDVGCLWERYSILNAYYFPGQRYEALYPSITPANSFRVIFNTYFGTELPLLADKNFYASYATPYMATDITGTFDQSCPIK